MQVIIITFLAGMALLTQGAMALTIRQDINTISPISSCNCYGESYSEEDCSGVSPEILNKLSCDGRGQIVNPYAVKINSTLPDRCAKYLYQKAEQQNPLVLSQYLKPGTTTADRNIVEMGGIMGILARNRILNVPSVGASNSCGFSTAVMNAAKDVSDVLFSSSMQFGSESLVQASNSILATERVANATTRGASASTIESLERQNDRVLIEDPETPHQRIFCQALDGCKLAGGTLQNISGQNYCVVGGLALDTSCLNLGPSLRSRFLRNLLGARDKGKQCLRNYGGQAAIAGDSLENHFNTSVNNLPRTHVCCGNSGCTQPTFGNPSFTPGAVRKIGGITYGGNSPNGTIIFSNSTLSGSNEASIQGLIFHEFLHRLGGSSSCLHNHQDRTSNMRPNSQGLCYPAAEGITSEIRFIAQNGQCVPDPNSPAATCARLMTTVPINQYDPVYACQTSCFEPRPQTAGPEQRRFDNTNDLCKGFIGRNALSSVYDSGGIRGVVSGANGTEREISACQFLVERNGTQP